MDLPHSGQMRLECRLDDLWQHRSSILTALAVTHRNLVLPEVDVLDAKLQALLEPHTGSVEKRENQPCQPVHATEDLADFVSGQDDRDSAPAFRAILCRSSA